MKLKIYLFRHAQTYYNKAHRFTGWKDSKLTPFGMRQAEKIARKLKGKRIDAAFHTRLSRSKDTLKEVLKYHPECREIVMDDLMIERSYGSLSGKSHKTLVDEMGNDAYTTLLHWHKIDHLHSGEKKEFVKMIGGFSLHIIRRSYDHPPPGGESIKAVEKRVLSFIKKLLKYMKENKANVAISAHGNSMRPFRRYFEHLTIEEMMKLENPWDDYFEYTVDV